MEQNTHSPTHWYPSSFPWFGARHEAYPVTWEQVFGMTTNTHNFVSHLTLQSRTARKEGNEEEAKRLKAACGGFTPAVFCTGGRREENIVALTQHCICDIDEVAEHMMPKLKRRATSDPHSLLSFTTNSEAGIRIIYPWVGVSNDGEILSPSEFVWNEKVETHAQYLERILPWHSAAFRIGNEYYADLLETNYDTQTSDAVRFSFYCHDPEAALNLSAMPFAVHQSVVEHIRDMSKPQSIDLQKHIDTGQRYGNTDSSPFDLALKWVSRRVSYVRGHRNQFIVQCIYILRDHDVSIAEAEAWVDRKFADYENEHTRHTMVRSCYKKH